MNGNLFIPAASNSFPSPVLSSHGFWEREREGKNEQCFQTKVQKKGTYMDQSTDLKKMPSLKIKLFYTKFPVRLENHLVFKRLISYYKLCGMKYIQKKLLGWNKK